MKTESAKTAKMIREALKELFPTVKFSVTSKNYSGGNSVTAYWTDGPTADMVNRAIDRFQSGDFDGMTDMYTYRHDREHSTAKYVFGSRTISKALAEYTLNYFKTGRGDGWPECGLEIVEYPKYWDFVNDSPMPNNYGYRSQEVNRYANHIAVNAKGEYIHDTSWHGFAHERKEVA
jgi:hypothetical protein